MPKLTVRDLMSEEVYTINANEDLLKLYNLMADIHIRHVPVVNDAGELDGIVSDRDLLKSALSTQSDLPLSEQRELLQTRRVHEIMTRDPDTVETDQDIREVGGILLDNKYSCLPVTDNEKVVGIITEADFVKYVCREVADDGDVKPVREAERAVKASGKASNH